MKCLLKYVRRVKWYTRYVRKYVTGRKKSFQPYMVYIFLIRITSRNRTRHVRLSVRMNAMKIVKYRK